MSKSYKLLYLISQFKFACNTELTECVNLWNMQDYQTNISNDNTRLLYISEALSQLRR